MSNSYFRFKQFIVRQDRCTMKVCTDSCLLGAWTANRLVDATKILDIGTGTGLLPLMLSQKSKCSIDSIESDPESAAQARENTVESPWQNRIQIIEGDVRQYPFRNKYDFIITNPPFYESDLRSPDAEKNKVKHDESLTLNQLLPVILSCLDKNGAFSILLPFHRTVYFENLATSYGLYLLEKLTIRQSSAHAPFRSILLFSLEKKREPFLSELIIKNERGKYSPEFSELMKDYYE